MARALFQRLSGVLIVPIVLIPVAAILIAAGFVLGGNMVLVEAGRAIIPGFLPLFFALAVVIGFADGDGWAALSATVGYAVMVAVATVVAGTPQPLNLGAPGGLVLGAAVAVIFNRFHRVQFPEFLGLFNGKRLIPSLSALAAIPLGLLAGWAWPSVVTGIEALTRWAYSAGPAGAFVYGALDRALVPLGLHHVVNNLVEYNLGSYVDPATGQTLLGEVARFLAGDPTAGRLMSGFYIFNNFSVPAMALAIGYAARPAHRRRILGLMTTGLLTSVITGITEPVEFAFVYAAPVLWVIDILFGGLASYMTYALNVRHWGYALPMFFINLSHAENPWWIPLLGVPFFAAQFLIFYFYIKRFRPAVPGQEEILPEGAAAAGAAPAPAIDAGVAAYSSQVLAALGGIANLESAVACATRLRLTLRDEQRMDEAALRRLGAHGIVRLGRGAVQVVLGARAEGVGADLQRLMGSGAAGAGLPRTPDRPGAPPSPPALVELRSPLSGTVVPLAEVPDAVFSRGMAGDGVAVRPTEGRLVAPCDGRVAHLFPGGHAVGLEGPGGLEVLLHIGIDTSDLHGAGFTVLVKEGQSVRAGDPLVQFDQSAIAGSGRSLVTPILITNMDRVAEIQVLTTGTVVAGATPLIRVTLKG